MDREASVRICCDPRGIPSRKGHPRMLRLRAGIGADIVSFLDDQATTPKILQVREPGALGGWPGRFAPAVCAGR
jgi:hypothetical protein